MSDQLPLPLEKKGPNVPQLDVDLLLSVLSGNGWLKANQIAEQIFVRKGLHWQERYIRAVAHASKGSVISYPGSPGYKITTEATIKEIQAASACLRHQANEMTRRATEIDRVYHGKIRN